MSSGMDNILTPRFLRLEDDGDLVARLDWNRRTFPVARWDDVHDNDEDDFHLCLWGDETPPPDPLSSWTNHGVGTSLCRDNSNHTPDDEIGGTPLLVSFSSSPTTVMVASCNRVCSSRNGMDAMWNPVTPIDLGKASWTTTATTTVTPSPGTTAFTYPNSSTIESMPTLPSVTRTATLPAVPSLLLLSPAARVSSSVAAAGNVAAIVDEDGDAVVAATAHAIKTAAAAAAAAWTGPTGPPGPPAIVTVPIRTGGFGDGNDGNLDDDDDEVSLLADNPDDDDVDVLPHATYDVLANIFDQIYKDDGDKEDGDDDEDEDDGGNDDDGRCSWLSRPYNSSHEDGPRDSSTLQSPPLQWDDERLGYYCDE